MGCNESKTLPYQTTETTDKAGVEPVSGSNVCTPLDKMQKPTAAELGPQRLLIVGAGESGKTTIIKQLIALYGTGFSQEQRAEYREAIVSNIFTSIKAAFSITEVSEEDRVVLGAAGAQLDPATADIIAAIWDRPGVKEAAQVSDFGLTHSCSYFLDRVQKVAQPGYLPCDQDIINCRIMTTDVSEYQLTVEDVPFTLCDMGGQRNYRGDWSAAFHDVTCVIFVASMAGYDETLREDDEMNRLQEALNMFGEIASATHFTNASLALVLNKDDVLRRKLRSSPLKAQFADYFGDNSHADARAFLRQKFTNQDQRGPDKSLASFAVAVDTASLSRTFNLVKDMIFCRGGYEPAALAAASMKAKVPPAAPPLEAMPVLDYWFCYDDFPVAPAIQLWTTEDAASDAAIADQFGSLMERAAEGALEDWMGSEGGSVALLLLLLEFPRRVYRGSQRMYQHHTRPVFRKFLRAMSPRRPRRLEDMPVAYRLWLSRMLSYSEDFQDVRTARSTHNRMAAHPMWSKTEDGPEQTFLNSLEADINQRMMLFNFMCRFPHRNLQNPGREFSITERGYFLAEVPAGTVRPFEQQWETLRDPQSIVAVPYVPSYSVACPPDPSIILDYWFGKNLKYERIPVDVKFDLWLKGSPHKDSYVKEHFAPLFALHEQRALEGWKATPSGTLAYLLVATQLPRTLFKGTARMYENDDTISPLVNAMVHTENPNVGGTVFESLKIAHQMWAIMLLTYSEKVEDYTIVMDWLEFVTTKVYWNTLPIEEGFFAHAKVVFTWKQDILKEFGRFPYKNFLLNRPMTEAETEHYRVGVRDGTLKEFEKVLPEHRETGKSQLFDAAAEQKRADAGEDCAAAAAAATEAAGGNAPPAS